MNRTLVTLAVIILGVAAGAAGYVVYRSMDGAPPPGAASTPSGPPAPTRLVGSPRPDFQLTGLDGATHKVSEWDGKVIILNFWATWCPPCKREIPAFIELQEQYGERGLQVVGVAIDQRQPVQEFTDYMGVNYPILVGETDATEVSKRYGNRYGQLPYTVFIDRDGRIAQIKRGEVKRDEAEKLIKPLL